MNQSSTITRRLAAVAFADVAGWTRLVEQDDVATVNAWKAMRVSVIEPIIAEHHGRLVEVVGDAVLVEFPSAVSAVQWAIDTQRGILPAKGDTGLALSIRIGINVEDVIVDDDGLLGDGINIASHLHQFASPGEVVVTRAVRDYVWNKLPVTFSDLGERHLQNIDRPIQIYRVDAVLGASPRTQHAQPASSWSRRPSVAVLPFRNLVENSSDSYFGEGITEDIIGALSRSHALYVIARNSTLRYRDTRADVREIAAELSVRYVLEGSVRRQSSRLRISANLIDVSLNQTIWAEKFDGALEDLFDFQDQIAARIVASIEPRLIEVEASIARSKPTESLDAYDCVLRALSLLYRFDDQSFQDAGTYLKKAVVLDPAYAQAHAYFAWWCILATGEGRSMDIPADSDTAVASSAKAVELDPNDALTLAVAGHARAFVRKDLDSAVELFARALKANESSAFAWGVSASTYCFLGEPEEAMERLRNAWKLSPFEPLNFWFWTVAGIAEFIAGRYENAIGWLRKAQRANPRFCACHRTLTATLALMGDLDAAKRAAGDLMVAEPKLRVSSFAARYPLRRADDLDRLVRGLRIAGVPD